MEQKLVSIILPTYNGASRIAAAIDSVRAQTYLAWELLIVSDGSADSTASIVEQYRKIDSRIIYIENETNVGIQKTLNIGLVRAKGSYIARIDDDDVWSDETKLAQQISFLELHPAHVLVGTGAIVVDEQGKEILRYLLPEDDLDIRNMMLQKNCFVHASVVFRKHTAMQCGGYSEAQAERHIEDYSLWLELGIQGNMANLRLYGVTLTERAESLSSKNRIIQAQRMVSKVLQYRKKYPQFLKGYFISTARFIYFSLYQHIPFRTTITRTVKRIYKNN